MKAKKLLATLLALAMVLSAFSACGNSTSSTTTAEAGSSEETTAAAPAEASTTEEAPADADEAPASAADAEVAASTDEDTTTSSDGLISTDYTYDLPLFDEDFSLSMWVSFSDNMSTFMPNQFSDNKAAIKAEEMTGVHVDFTCVSTTANTEQFNLRVASGDLPNVITNVSQLWSSSFDSAIDDEVFIDLTDMIENYMPAYKECYDQLDDDTKRQLHTDSGYFPKLISINNYPAGATEGAFIRTDYLEKVGLDVPTTYEELDEVLHAFQSELGLTEALMMPAGIVHTSNALCSGYGVFGGFSTSPMVTEPYYVVDGEVKFGIVEEGFKEYMEMFSTYYAEGIISADFMSKNQNPMDFGSTIASGTTGVFFGETNMVPNYIADGTDLDPDFAIAPLGNITKEEGETTHFGTTKSPISGRLAGISVSTADVDLEKLGTYLDFFFTEEGALLSAMGVEGNDDGSYVYDENGDLQYSDYWYSIDLTENEKPTLFIYSVMPMLCPKTPDSYTVDLQYECAPTWDANSDDAYQMPDAISMTSDETTDYNVIYGDIQTLIEENLTKFAVGERSMDEWDSFVQQIYDLGIEDCIAIKQQAVDRYYSRSL
jgi:putative aldouronate transport system substrate-binding protein